MAKRRPKSKSTSKGKRPKKPLAEAPKAAPRSRTKKKKKPKKKPKRKKRPAAKKGEIVDAAVILVEALRYMKLSGRVRLARNKLVRLINTLPER
jgi:hypothetical protein